MKDGDKLIELNGKELTLLNWLPYSGLSEKGKWLCKNKHGTTCQLSEKELEIRGYKSIVNKEG